MNKFKAVIFDMDGTLIDSDLHWNLSERDFLKRYNIKATPELAMKFTGRSLQEAARILKEEYRLPHSYEDILAHKIASSEKIYTDHTQALPGVDELLKTLKLHQLKTAIASGSSLDRIKLIVDRFGWHSYFDQLVSSDHVDYLGKPHPQIYQYTAEVLRVPSHECVVLEDSVNGVTAAKGAGMVCIAVPDPRWSYGDYSQADLMISSLQDAKLLEFLGI